MKIIGLTSPIGCGKSYIASIFAEYGVPTIDSDKIYHSLVQSGSELLSKIENAFGKDVIGKDGALDRRYLSKIVFSDKEKLNKLNSITHEAVIQRILSLISEYEKKDTKAVTVQVPLMFESGFDHYCDIVICVCADLETRTERVQKRDACTREEALKKINSQKDIQFYIANSDKVVYNDICDHPRAQVLSILNELGIGYNKTKG